MQKDRLPNETIEWLSKDKAKMTVEKEIPLDDGKTKGFKKELTVVETAAEEIIHGQELMKARLEKNQEKMESLSKQKEDLGKKPLKTPEIIKLEENLGAISKLVEIEKLLNQLENIQKQIDWDTELIKRRQGLLDQRPKE